jgi:hypothetical protein
MTIKEFNETGWSGGMFCLYKGKQHAIGSCDFEEGLVGIVDESIDDISWVRCENITLVTP